MLSSIISRLREHQRATQVLILLTLVIAFAANIYGIFTGITIVLPHLFYIPIILAAFFYPRRGILFATALCAVYLLIVTSVYPGNSPEFLSAVARCIVYLIIAIVVSWLSEQAKDQKNGLVRAKEEWEITFDAVPDLIALIGKDYRILRVNKAMAESLGISPEQAVGLICYEVVHHTSAHPAFCPHAKLMKDGQGHAAEVHENNLGGNFLITTTPLHDSGGNLIGSVHIARDITKRKKAEQALKESEERYRTILENIQDVYFRFDEESLLVMMSPSAVRTFGYHSVEEVLGCPATTFWKNPKEWAHMIDTMKKQDGSVQDWQAEFVRMDGTPFWVSVSARLYTDDAGEYQGTEGIIRDISVRKQMEEALKGTLTKLNMLSSITRHDILNQITGLRTYLELSKEDLKGTRFEEFVDKEVQAAEAIQRQIEFTKYYQDIGVNAPKWQEAGPVIREAAAQLNFPAPDLNVMVDGLEIFADPLIAKVFFNLMENSLRHGERVTAMSFSSRVTDTGLVITYCDNGVGITEEDKKKLFRKGFGKHTGLGLFLSREILAITGISIVEKGEPGAGAGVRFEITVPKEGYRHYP
ncbi:MAG: PAS domain-containing sensor histidine kinase [Methanoregula sp.]|nr:PAS domain-containing sensor histidine kinase [Methanoregula sp.]